MTPSNINSLIWATAFVLVFASVAIITWYATDSSLDDDEKPSQKPVELQVLESKIAQQKKRINALQASVHYWKNKASK